MWKLSLEMAFNTLCQLFAKACDVFYNWMQLCSFVSQVCSIVRPIDYCGERQLSDEKRHLSVDNQHLMFTSAASCRELQRCSICFVDRLLSRIGKVVSGNYKRVLGIGIACGETAFIVESCIYVQFICNCVQVAYKRVQLLTSRNNW